MFLATAAEQMEGELSHQRMSINATELGVEDQPAPVEVTNKVWIDPNRLLIAAITINRGWKNRWENSGGDLRAAREKWARTPVQAPWG